MFGRVGRLFPVMAVMLLLGCAEGPTAQPVSASSTASAAPAPPASAPGHYDGLYVGTTVSTRPPAVNCPAELTVNNFRVENNEVRFGGFRGAIENDGSVRILNRGILLEGRFSGTEFRGEITQYAGGAVRRAGRYRGTRTADYGERCMYATALRREAS